MAEEEPKKKRCVVKRILKWVGLGVLGLLIILGLIFQAPWKVMAVLVVFLLAHTALPKPGLKWFWVGVGVVVLALVIWVFLPEDDTSWRPYTFDEELAALEAKYAIPDEENAATIYIDLLANYNGYIHVYPDLTDKDLQEIRDLSADEYSQLADQARPKDTFYPEFWNSDLDYLTFSGHWSRHDHPEIAEWLDEKEGIIGSLIKASQIEECRFPITIDHSDLQQTNRNSAMRRWAKLLIRAANNDTAEGYIDKAIEKGVAVLRMGEHLRQQRTIIDILNGIAIEAIGLRQFNRFIVTGGATERHLAFIEEALPGTKHEWSSELHEILESEKLVAKNLLGVTYEINPKGEVRLSRDFTKAIGVHVPLPPLTYWQKRLARVGVILGWFGAPSTPQEAGEIVDAAYERYYAMAEPGYDWENESEKTAKMFRLNYRYLVEHLTEVLEPAYHKVHDIYLRLKADKQGSQILVALRRHKNANGRWPESLDGVQTLVPPEALVDPISGGAFAYKLTDDGFTLYSRGKNNIDDGGERDDKAGTDDWLIWPKRTRSCEPKEENANGEKE